MPRSLSVRPRAQADVDEQSDYLIADRSHDQAIKFLVELQHVFERLLRFPQFGRPWPTNNPALAGLRRAALPSFPLSVFYMADADEIAVVRVLHHARDIPPLLEDI